MANTAPSSPSWHRRLRCRRSKARLRLAAGLPVFGKGLLVLARHHATNPSLLWRLGGLMGKSGKAWRSDKNHDHGGWQSEAQDKTESWQWSGASSPFQAPWRPNPKAKAAFPAYNARAPKDITAGSSAGAAAPGITEEGGSSLFQALLNNVRKAEGKVHKIQTALSVGKTQWKEWEQDMKATWMKNKARFAKDQERLQKDLAEALDLQRASQIAIQRAVLGQPAEPTGHIVEEECAQMEWENMTAQWEVDDNADEEVLRRALAASMGPVQRVDATCITPQRPANMPDRSPLPTGNAGAALPGAAMGQAMADPYLGGAGSGFGAMAPSPGTLASSFENLGLATPPQCATHRMARPFAIESANSSRGTSPRCQAGCEAYDAAPGTCSWSLPRGQAAGKEASDAERACSFRPSASCAPCQSAVGGDQCAASQSRNRAGRTNVGGPVCRLLDSLASCGTDRSCLERKGPEGWGAVQLMGNGCFWPRRFQWPWSFQAGAGLFPQRPVRGCELGCAAFSSAAFLAASAPCLYRSVPPCLNGASLSMVSQHFRRSLVLRSLSGLWISEFWAEPFWFCPFWSGNFGFWPARSLSFRNFSPGLAPNMHIGGSGVQASRGAFSFGVR